MNRRNFGKKTILIVIWLISLVVFGAASFQKENRVSFEKAQKSLLAEARKTAGQIPTIAYNNLYSTVALFRIQNAKLDALSLALEQTEDIDQARELIDRISQAANITDLTIYDKDGTLIYSSADDPQNCLSFEAIMDVVEFNFITAYEGMLEFPSYYTGYYFSSEFVRGDDGGTDEDDDADVIAKSIKNGQWVLGSRDILTQKEIEILGSFAWRNVFREMKIGQGGFLAAFDNQDGTILSYKDRDELTLQPVEALDIRIAGADHAAAADDLQEAFSVPNKIVNLRIEGMDYFAVRLRVDDTMILALQPLAVIQREIFNTLSMRLFLLFVMTGICVMFAVLHMQDLNETIRKGGKGIGWNKALSSALEVCAILTGIALLVLYLFLDSLLLYADTFRDTSEKVSTVISLYSNNAAALEELEDWSSEEYLIRCRIAKTILDHSRQKDITPEYLERLSESLGIDCIYMYDKQGNILVTNSPYDNASLSRSNPFYALLESQEEMSGHPTLDTVSGKYMQKAGISLRDRDNKCSGLILIEGDVEEIYEIAGGLDYENLFKQAGLSDGSSVLVINDSTDTVAYAAEVQNGSYKKGLESFDYSGLPVSEINLDESRLYDDYNGGFSAIHRYYFASVRRTQDGFFLVMKPYPGISTGNSGEAVRAMLFLLIFAALVMLISCLQRKTGAPVPEENPDVQARKADAESKADGQQSPDDANIRSTFDSIVKRRKAGFEERWPKDCTKWKDKTSDEKSWLLLKRVFIIAFFLVVLNMGIAGEDSVWSYIFTADRSMGINLQSVTTIVFSVSILIAVHAAIHKLLFLTARALDQRGETICMLLDSFSGYVLGIVAVFSALSNLGINIKALSLTAGVAGVIFSLGCQNIVADILSGILMTIEGVIHVGDFLFFEGSPFIVHGISVRTTSLKWFGQITVVRNNDFKKFARRLEDTDDLVQTSLNIDLKESLENVEGILEKELPRIHEMMCEFTGEPVNGPAYRGVTNITENSIELIFVFFCKGRHSYQLRLMMNRELKLLCEKYGIAIAMPQIVVNEPAARAEREGQPEPLSDQGSERKTDE